MKTLLLASSGGFVTERAFEFLSKPLKDMKIAYIDTASRGVEDTSYMERHKVRMKELKWDFEEIDIAGMKEEKLRQTLKDKEVIYVEGGNTFYLMKAIRESGFQGVLEDLLEQGVIYIGTSAGSYVCSPSIEMANWKHQDKYDHYGVTDLTGMNLVPFIITAHYVPEYMELISEKIKTAEHPVRILTDEQALLIQDDEVQLVGDEEEVSL